MWRAEITGANEPLKITRASTPAPPSHGARLRTVFSGICHSDIHVIQDSGEYIPGISLTRRDVYKKQGKSFEGIVLGHEIAGVIEEFGEESDPDNFDLKVGDFVLVYPWVGCGQCEACIRDGTFDCANNPKMINNYGFSPINAGGYSTHVLAHKLSILIKVPDAIPRDVAATLPCSGLTAYTSLKKTAEFLEQGFSRNKCAKLLVAGSGGLGLWCIQLAKLMFSKLNIEITAADISPEKLQIAQECGAKCWVLWKPKYDSLDDQLAEVQKTTREGQYQFDAAIDFVGSPNTFCLAYRSLRPAGTIVSVGLFGGQVKLPLLELVRSQYKIQGNTTGTLGDMNELVNLLTDKNVTYSKVDHVSLQDVNETLSALKNGNILGRAVIKF